MPITIDGTNGITQAGEFNSDSTFGFKNRIINGGMGIWQRGTPITTSGGYTADRWTQVSGNSIVHTQSTDAPTGFTNSLQMAGTGSNIAQRIESVNCLGLGGATVTVSLWYKNSTGSDSLSLSLYYANSTNSFGSVTQIGSNQTLAASPSSSWTYYTVTFTNISANAVNGLALYIFRGSSATATGLLTGVQLEVGSIATSFDYRPFGTELLLCQRYCQKSYNQGTAPGSNVAASGDFILNGGWGTANAAKVFYAYHQVPLRPGTQTLSFWDVVGNASKISTYDVGFSRTDNVNANGGNGVNENRNYTAPGTTTINGWAWAYLVTSEL
jgi:hypothetical protein